jgi:YidC/Oxa1 family membrane protein insertase
MLRLPIDEIKQLVYGVGGFAPQLQVLESVYGELRFLGLNLTVTPSIRQPSIELIVPLVSGLVAFIFCMVQNAISPGALSQGKRTNMGLTIFTVCLSLYFAFALPVGVGLYWTVGNFAAIGVVLLLNLLYPPQKLAKDALVHIQATRKTKEQLLEDKRIKNELRERENADVVRFKAAKKQVVFYAISSGQYKFYKVIIDYLLEHSDITVHYLTNDPHDAVYNIQHPQLLPYYASQQKTISLMLTLRTDIMVTTVPDLQNFHMKRSIVRDDIEYIHTFHGPTSTHLVYREKAFDHFNTLFCAGSHQVAEIRRRETIAKLPKKKLVKIGYGLYDQLVASYENQCGHINEKARVLIAPSWQADNILDVCINTILESISGNGYDVVVRPHPQYIRLFPRRINTLKEQFANNDEITFELDFLGNESIFASDILITDWSNIGYEFAYCTLKPCIFINTPMKIMNPNYTQYGIEPMDIALRNKVGVSVDVENVGKIDATVSELLLNKDSYSNQIDEIVQQCLYNPGRSGEAGGIYIIKQLEVKKTK